MNVYLSCVCKGEISASVVYKNGRCVAKNVVRVATALSNGAPAQYKNIIRAYTSGFRLLKHVIESDKTIDNIVVESNNSAFLSWINKGVTLPQYEEDFATMLEVLDEIPVKYECIYSKELRAKSYAKATCLTREKLSGLDDFLNA